LDFVASSISCIDLSSKFRRKRKGPVRSTRSFTYFATISTYSSNKVCFNLFVDRGNGFN